ncbi:2-methylisocitrate lyase-like PEP mutase family enzyme [Mycobacterium frederiksbergense]|uniref:2-methylisocitrate lyase-like PEP mutase family enzyme n=1 Tax=Mycolicibacterium frederiksbergense TaxID=117567 RepID=A0ABT6KXV0_9MYCO|nr:hypothetical protein [Mycolicibacterium frederiksbergense]MDH6195533.1 2-methylisocitrate lyase-like PEP mutase family enzyme [Mycolicibacterium frederiksbergense]
MRREEAHAKAGADIIFVEAPESKEQMRTIGTAFDVPVRSNQLHGGVTPILPPNKLQDMGFAAAIYPTVGLFAASQAVASVYHSLAQDHPVTDPLCIFGDFVDMIGFPKVSEFEQTYAEMLTQEQI